MNIGDLLGRVEGSLEAARMERNAALSALDRAGGSGGPVSTRVLSNFEDSGKVPALQAIVPALLKSFLEGAG
ncbi:MAG: hypothetical protein O7D96_08710 [SAR324 cluster bacterium]|nr:hypothetical protein [SAR324 cluster bacterium]